MITTLNQRIEGLENKIATLSDKQEVTLSTLDSMVATQPPKSTAVAPHPADGAGTPIDKKKMQADLEHGFIEDSAIKSYRQAIILFRAERYQDAVLSFSAFLERFADHALAGSAQYYVGESYFRQKEYKLALQEFQRVLTSYDRSSHVSDTLARMAEAEDILKKDTDAAKHRQMLTSLFPQSPAAGNVPSPRNKSADTTMDSPPENATPDSQAAADEKIHKAVSEVMQKANSGGERNTALDEPPPTAPVPKDTE